MTEQQDPWAVIEAAVPKPASERQPPSTTTIDYSTGGTAYGRAALEQEVRRVTNAPEGCRNERCSGRRRTSRSWSTAARSTAQPSRTS